MVVDVQSIDVVCRVRFSNKLKMLLVLVHLKSKISI